MLKQVMWTQYLNLAQSFPSPSKKQRLGPTWPTAFEVGRKVLGASGDQMVYVDAISPGGSDLQTGRSNPIRGRVEAWLLSVSRKEAMGRVQEEPLLLFPWHGFGFGTSPKGLPDLGVGDLFARFH